MVRLLARLRSQKKQDTGLQGKSKLLGSSDKDKARGRVRKAIAAAISFVGQQSPEVAKTLETSIGEGQEIYFNSPPDWGI